MEHQMKLSKVPYEAVADGTKVIESRLNDEKRQQISLGDVIVFSENDHPENTTRTKVIGLLRYTTFKDLFADHDPALFAGENSEFLLSQIKAFYPDQEEQKYGVVGIRIERVD